MYAVYDERVMERSSEEDMAWAPLFNLLEAGILLEDLIFDWRSQFCTESAQKNPRAAPSRQTPSPYIQVPDLALECS
jgi:hypothetical protein